MVSQTYLPENNPGKGMNYNKINNTEVSVINLQGHTFLPPSDDPYKKFDSLIKEARKRTNIIFVDFHGEATSEKQAFGWYVDGLVSSVVGTHTHTQTADDRILPNGTDYITDVWMTGPYDIMLGMYQN